MAIAIPYIYLILLVNRMGGPDLCGIGVYSVW